MLKNKILSLFILLFVYSCATSVSSMEFRTAKTAARSEKKLDRAEEWGVKALNHEVHANDPLVPYFFLPCSFIKRHIHRGHVA